MKFLFASLLIIPFLLSSCSGTAQSNSQAKNTTEVIQMTATQAKARLEKGGVKVVDVRTPGEFASGHIKGAINVNFSSPNFEKELSKLDKDQEYLVHCRSGHRSGLSLKSFKKLGFKKIDHLTHGIMDWTKSGYPLEK